MPTTKKKSAGARLKAQGKTLIWVAPTAEQKTLIRTAAGNVGQPMSQFLLDCGLREAEKIMGKIRNSPLT